MNLTFLLSAGSERDTNFQYFRLQNPFGGNKNFDGTLIFRLLYNLKQFQGEIRQNCFKEEAQLVVRLPCSTNHMFHLFFFTPSSHPFHSKLLDSRFESKLDREENSKHLLLVIGSTHFVEWHSSHRIRGKMFLEGSICDQDLF